MLHPLRMRSTFAVAVIAMAVLVLAPRDIAAASCAGNSHDMTLSGGKVSPGTGSPSTTFTFKVVYTDNNGCSPDRIVVVIPGEGTFNLGYVSGGLQQGATFGRSMSLPAGIWDYRFEATSGSGPGLRNAKFTNVAPANVRVVAPTPKPTQPPPPDPTPPPPATPRPTAVPVKTPEPTPEPTPAPTVTAHPSRPTPSPAPDGSPTPAAITGAGIADGRVEGRAGSAGGSTGGSAGITTDRTALDLGRLPVPWLALLVASIGALIGLTLFALLSKWLADPGRGPSRSSRSAR